MLDCEAGEYMEELVKFLVVKSGFALAERILRVQKDVILESPAATARAAPKCHVIQSHIAR